MPRTRDVSNEQILDAARKVFISNGLTGTVKSVAALAGVSEALIYQRFATKNQLIARALSPESAPPPAAPAIVVSDIDAARRFEDLAATLFTQLRRDAPRLLPLMARETARSAGLAPTAAFERARDAIATFLETAPGVGRLPLDRAAAAYYLAAALHQAVLFEVLEGPSPFVSEHAARSVARLVWQGLHGARP